MSVFDTGAKLFARLAAVGVLSMLAACGTFYVDTNIHDLTPAERAIVATPRPVQLLFDFQTKGVSNSTARDYVKNTVIQAVEDTGLFSAVGPDAQPGGAILQVTINNVPLSDDAFAKGFVTGFTFGLVGNTVGDGYICTAEYIGGPNDPKISKSVRDAIYTSLGATASAPQHAQKVSNMDAAVKAMTHKCVGNAIDQVARDPGFAK